MSWYVDELDAKKDVEIKTLKISLGKTTCHFIGDELRPLYVDALVIYNACLANDAIFSKLSSLHYLLIPMTYAIETTLFKLANELKMDYESKSTIGTVFNKKGVSLLSEKISDKRQRTVVEEQLGYLGGFVQEYRNNPIHNGLELSIESKQQLQNKLAAILDRIKSLIESLEKVGLLTIVPFTKPTIGTTTNWG